MQRRIVSPPVSATIAVAVAVVEVLVDERALAVLLRTQREQRADLARSVRSFATMAQPRHNETTWATRPAHPGSSLPICRTHASGRCAEGPSMPSAATTSRFGRHRRRDGANADHALLVVDRVAARERRREVGRRASRCSCSVRAVSALSLPSARSLRRRRRAPREHRLARAPTRTTERRVPGGWLKRIGFVESICASTTTLAPSRMPNVTPLAVAAPDFLEHGTTGRARTAVA